MICIDAITIIHFTCFLFYMIFAVAVFSGGVMNMRLRMLLFLFLVAFGIISFNRAVFFNTCADAQLAGVGFFITIPLMISNSALAFLLCLGFNEKNKLSNSPYLYLVMALYAAVFTALTWSGMIQHLVRAGQEWKIVVSGLDGFIYSRLDDFLVIGTVFILASQTYHEAPGLKRRQGIIILTTAAISVFLVYASKLIGPFKDVNIPTNVIILIVTLGMAAAIRLYGFIELTPAFAASAVFNTSSEMMLLVEPAGKIAKANRSFVLKMGLNESQVEMMEFSSILEGGKAAYDSIMEKAKKENTASAQMKVKAAGEWMYCHVAVALLKRSNIQAGAVAVLTDITELSITQNELKKYRDTLEAMVKERTMELDNANIKLTQKARTATEFNKASHHDLMEPVLGIVNVLQRVLLRKKDQLDKESNSDIETAVNYAKRLHLLIRDMREYINVDYLSGENLPGNPSAALKEESRGLENKAVIVSTDLPQVYCPQVLLNDIFRRLIDNSIMFSGRIPVNIWVSAVSRGQEVEFTFEDDGAGVAETYLETIFGVFERLLDRENYPGNGMGLAICRKIAEIHGGKMWAQRSEKGGLAVKFTLKATSKDSER